MSLKNIRIRGARTHNLKNIDLDLPRNKLIVITGLSGSGKSSLAFDTIFAEGQRRYVESLSAYARQFLSIMEKPDIDNIEGLSPAIAIEQKSTSHNPRSTVGTITEIYDYLRLLFARAGDPYCPRHGGKLEAKSISQMVDAVLKLPAETKFMLLAPVIRQRKGEHLAVFDKLRSSGYARVRVNNKVYQLDEVPSLSKNKKHSIDVVVDRLKVRPEIAQRLAESFETALAIADSLAIVSPIVEHEFEQMSFSAKFACTKCGYTLAELEPKLFSFNNPAGACFACDGLGMRQVVDVELLVSRPELSLAAGAVRGWDRTNGYYFQMLCALGKHFGFDVDTPFKNLDKKIQDLILYGSGNTVINFEYRGESGRSWQKSMPFEGIIPNMERRYLQTESASVREELNKFKTEKACEKCAGSRLNPQAQNVFIAGTNIAAITAMSINAALEHFKALELQGAKGQVAAKIRREIELRLQFLINVGLDYLSLDRGADTLSGGEAQRIRLASQIGAGLVGVMYVLDEPSIGLHQRDNARLLKTLTYLRDLGNTVIVVEHDEEAILAADFVVDLGPGAGVHGGAVVAKGSPQQIIANQDSLTGNYLAKKKQIFLPKSRKKPSKQLIRMQGLSGNNLQNIDVQIPIGLLTCVTGVSGSGKSTLINDTLYAQAARTLNNNSIQAAPFVKIDGFEHLDKVIDIDQSPIGRTPRSNPATYTGLFTSIRELYAGTEESRARGYKPGRFSFNVKGGRCEACQGDGVIKVEMHFLPDVYVPCDLCHGKRYNRETLEVHYKGKNIHQVLAMTIEEAYEFFNPVPVIARRLKTLLDVGLSYICLGQSATTLSGGEAQRVKLARELSKRDTGKTLYILDEPTTGLHFHDVAELLKVIHKLCDKGNTMVIIEHNLEVIKTADWIIDLGPEGGNKGGKIVATGTPEEVAANSNSHTGRYLQSVLDTA